jgi:hypothetical protein
MVEARSVGGSEEDQAPGLEGIDPVKAVHAAAELARDNPHTAVASALAVGFLLGGGLTPRLLVSLAMIAGRRYAAEAAREALAEAVRRQMDEVTAR